jgi:hypothetical protein
MCTVDYLFCQLACYHTACGVQRPSFCDATFLIVHLFIVFAVLFCCRMRLTVLRQFVVPNRIKFTAAS